MLKVDTQKNYETLCDRLLSSLHRSCLAIDIGWQKVRTSFAISAAIAGDNLEKGREYLALGEGLKKDIHLQTPEMALAIIVSLRLAIAALAGLLQSRQERKEDIERLGDLIDKIPSHGERALLWGDLALRYLRAGRSDDAKKVVYEHVSPLMEKIPPEDSGYKARVFLQFSFILYRANPITTREQITKLPPQLQNEAWSLIAGYILRKEPLFEPFESVSGHEYSVTYAEVVEICDLMKEIQADFEVYSLFEKLADSITGDKRRVRYTAEQRQDVVKRLDKLAEKFPNLRFIQHHGYQIAAKAQIMRIQDVRGQPWTDLISEANKIPNISDRAFVLIIIAGALPSRESARRPNLVSTVQALIQSIPAAYDRAGRLKFLAENLAQVERSLCKQFLREAMQEGFEIPHENALELQRSIIDFAHRLDPEIAAGLVTMADNDPARLERRDQLRKQLRILDARKGLGSGKKEKTAARGDLPLVAWRSLAALNAGRLPPYSLEQLRGEISRAASLPLSDSYPVFAWALSNISNKYAETPNATRLLRPVFESTLIACQLCDRVVSRSAFEAGRSGRAERLNVGDESSLLVRPGERVAAVAFLKDWLANSLDEYLKICDPYFGPEDLEVLQWVTAVRPGAQVWVLTSAQHQRALNQPPEDAYRTHWRMRLSAADPPDTEILVIGTRQKGEFPIHDRWWVTKRAGIRMGTSLNSLGMGKDSELSLLTEREAKEREEEIDCFLRRNVKEHMGDKILYTVFTL